MNEIINKLKLALKKLEQEYGEFYLFALFLREGALGKWDLLVSTSWLNSDDLSSYSKITEDVQKYLTAEEMTQLARIVILDPKDPSVVFLQDLYDVPNGTFQEAASEPLSDKFGFSIKRALLLRCVRPK